MESNLRIKALNGFSEGDGFSLLPLIFERVPNLRDLCEAEPQWASRIVAGIVDGTALVAGRSGKHGSRLHWAARNYVLGHTPVREIFHTEERYHYIMAAIGVVVEIIDEIHEIPAPWQWPTVDEGLMAAIVAKIEDQIPEARQYLAHDLWRGVYLRAIEAAIGVAQTSDKRGSDLRAEALGAILDGSVYMVGYCDTGTEDRRDVLLQVARIAIDVVRQPA